MYPKLYITFHKNLKQPILVKLSRKMNENCKDSQTDCDNRSRNSFITGNSKPIQIYH